MKYKGYTGVVEFDEESGVLFGRVIGLRDLITFEGDSVAEVTRAFHDSVDVYLELCAERGESPERPFSGNFVLRIDPQLHRAISHAAEERGVSLNALVEDQLRTAFVPPEGLRRPAAVSAATDRRRAVAAKVGPRRGGVAGTPLKSGEGYVIMGPKGARKGPVTHESPTPKSSKGGPAGKGRKGGKS